MAQYPFPQSTGNEVATLTRNQALASPDGLFAASGGIFRKKMEMANEK
jgi:hypothetical protein